LDIASQVIDIAFTIRLAQPSLCPHPALLNEYATYQRTHN